MALYQEEEYEDLMHEIFDIDAEVKLTKKEQSKLETIEDYVKDLVSEYGLEGDTRIREIVLDELLKDKYDNIVSYLGMDFEDEIKETFEKKLSDQSFLRIENKEEDKDFFKAYLNDEKLNDLYYSWRGYLRKADGSKEVFEKARKAIVPTDLIDDIYNLLEGNFNKIAFLAHKQDEEVADIIILTLSQILEMLEERPNVTVTTEDTIAIMSACAIKMLNLVGFTNRDNQDKILSALSESYQSKHTTNDRKAKLDDDY